MSAHAKLMKARIKLQGMELRKSGENKFAGYKYFELGDFVIPALEIFKQVGLTSVIRFTVDHAFMEIVNTEKPEEKIVISSPMSTAALKGCHEVQNLGAVQTYIRRYLWVAALEIVEHDALDATTGKGEKKSYIKSLNPKNEEYTGAEKVSHNSDDPSSRFVGTTALTDVYKKATPGQSTTLKTIKKVVSEAMYKGREVKLGKPMKGDVKKSKVYVKNPETGNIKKVEFGDPNMKIKKNIPERRKSFRARHKCDEHKSKLTAGYWSCKAW